MKASAEKLSQPIQMATRKQRTNRGHDMGWTNSCGLLECKLAQSLWTVICSSLEKPKVDLPYVPATPLLGTEPKESRFTWNSDTSVPKFTAALVTNPKVQKESICQSMNESFLNAILMHNEVYLPMKNKIVYLM